jgi:hypothetical protein
MSDRVTSIRLRHCYDPGITFYGHKTVSEMIALMRHHAEQMKREAEELLAARDEDFYICTYKGVHVQRGRVILQEGRKP